ncbi:carbamoyl-phosphate synthase domain-containing protein [Chloroflexota bacterium]
MADGEVVSDSSMNRSQEMLTDPSYAGQIVVLNCFTIGKKLNNGHPVDIICADPVSGVVNTVDGECVSLIDGVEVRRTGAEKRVRCLTFLDILRAAVKALFGGAQAFLVQPLM